MRTSRGHDLGDASESMPSVKSLSAILYSASGLTRMHDENEGCVLMLCDVWEPKQMFLPGYAANKMLCSLATITTSYACSGDIFILQGYAACTLVSITVC